MPKLKAGTVVPTRTESEQIDAATQTDPASISYTEAEWLTVKPLARVGRPRSLLTKERITIRLSREVLDQFRASGEGWQTRVDAALKDWLKDHSPA